jgi:hypothetical protein
MNPLYPTPIPYPYPGGGDLPPERITAVLLSSFTNATPIPFGLIALIALAAIIALVLGVAWYRSCKRGAQ